MTALCGTDKHKWCGECRPDLAIRAREYGKLGGRAKGAINTEEQRAKQRASLEATLTVKRQEMIAEWMCGERVLTPAKKGLPGLYKAALLEEVGNACQRCGRSRRHPVTGNYVLHIDHVNGNPRDHRRENVAVLCPNCHVLTPTWGTTVRG